MAAGAVVLAVGTGCTTSTSTAASSNDPRPLVLTTFTVLADIARNVAGEHLRVESIIKAGAEIHGYEPTPGDLKNAASASLILDNGLGLESWFGQFVADLEVPHAVLSDGVEPITITNGAYSGKANPHAWMSPTNAQRYVDNIVTAFADLDPANAADYRANAEAYKAQLRSVREDLVRELAPVPENQRALVTCEGAFSYLARDVGLREAYLWPVNAEHEGTPKQVVATIEFVRDNKVPAIFCESTVSDKAQTAVSEDTGAPIAGKLYVDSLSGADGPVPTYLDLLRFDTHTIAQGLTRP
ncbi:metal ABC transporter substrate-binding protein [Antrihabitans stalagmiti]|uniref:metal ABC transporter substrate-binding protein n=1 Tax=Antrihabitans stalagmiti TaxID=2799499 RepID=UPI001F38BEE5|nr:metal ABC transporter substrate-binding protein [Antrihabitans stalagmiti]